jgi:hypothetical protein
MVIELTEGLELSQIQKDILHALIMLYKRISSSIRAEDIAELINRRAGTIRNQMQVLRVLGLVEGLPGPKGGYRPTAKAYELLSITNPEESVRVPVTVNGMLMDDLSAEEIVLPSLSHPEICQAKVKILGDIRSIKLGDKVTIGPTPVKKLVVYGRVEGRDDTESMLVLEIEQISLPSQHNHKLSPTYP